MSINVVRTRRDVRSRNEWDDTLVWYARAVAHMQKRPLSDPTSWAFQAAVHGHEPFGQKPGVWDVCQHQSWYFLPWHRGYLRWFEQIVQAAILELHGPEGWALPYWNYSDAKRADARVLPPAFRSPKLPDGTANALFVGNRDQHVNAGQPIGPAADVKVDALDLPRFVADPLGGSGGFGGPKTRFHHGGGRFGDLEAVPHGAVHVDIGGLMGDPATAAADPIFWLHHANIDRLWEIWRKNAAHHEPTAGSWRNLTFDLHDATGKPVSFTPAQMLDTQAAPLFYRYDSLDDPRGAPAPALAAAVAEPMADKKVTPEMVGATTEAVELGAAPASTTIATSPPTGPAAGEGVAGDLVPLRIFLQISNVTGAAAATNYDVYLNLPAAAALSVDSDEYGDHHAGVMTTFGIARASSVDDEHGGSGLFMSFDVTDLVHRQQDKGTWDPNALQVTFVPRTANLDLPPVKVGQISLHYVS